MPNNVREEEVCVSVCVCPWVLTVKLKSNGNYKYEFDLVYYSNELYVPETWPSEVIKESENVMFELCFCLWLGKKTRRHSFIVPSDTDAIFELCAFPVLVVLTALGGCRLHVFLTREIDGSFSQSLKLLEWWTWCSSQLFSVLLYLSVKCPSSLRLLSEHVGVT